MGKKMGETINKAIIKVVIRVEDLYLKIPYSIENESMENSLEELSSLLQYDQKKDFIRRPYSGLDYEAKLLSDLSKALRIRMELNKTLNVSGIEYFSKRLEEFLEKVRYSLGYNPHIPLNLNERSRPNIKI
ncbi:hypothetical protein [Caldisphaera sp.]|jgi:phage-related protein|uniref:hypothetical protein n=2 Tax=Caldisphaera sp. TaxID=2060322 RepID=UPI0025BD1DFC|nr:hypothetical protein [Caldisphaera sp.]